MSNPYAGRPGFTFWRSAVSEVDPHDIDLIAHAPFRIGATDAVATAGSCFAQHIARTLAAAGFNYLVTERGPLTEGAADEGYGLFSARFGNIYTVRQMLQLFDRAYGVFEPADRAWRGSDGGYVDPFRPRIQSGGFRSVEALEEDRSAHLGAVRRMFETCKVFIFTLGLTEAWVSTRDGAVFPLAPGVGGTPDDPSAYAPRNFRSTEVAADLEAFLDGLREVNPDVRVILTVSPVPLAATFEDRHVGLSTAYSKAVLRAVAEEVSADKDWVAYFPSYDLVTAHYSGEFFEADRRGVSPEGVARVMAMFRRHYLAADGQSELMAKASPKTSTLTEADRLRYRSIEAVVCDEDAIEEGLRDA